MATCRGSGGRGGWLVGSNKMHQGENYQDFLKWGVVLGHSLQIIKWTWGFFSQNLKFDPPPLYNYHFLKLTVKWIFTWKFEAFVPFRRKMTALPIFSKICQKRILIGRYYLTPQITGVSFYHWTYYARKTMK